MIESILTEISERGWRLNNLFQREDGNWQANIRRSNFFTEFAVAQTPSEALSICIDRIETAIEAEERKISHTITKTEPTDVSAILSRLIKPAQTIKRRI